MKFSAFMSYTPSPPSRSAFEAKEVVGFEAWFYLIVYCVVNRVNRDEMVIYSQNMYSKNCVFGDLTCVIRIRYIVIDWQPENRVILKLQFLAQRRLRISSGLPTGVSPSMAFLRYHMQTRTAIWRRFVRKVSIASTWNTFETFLSNLCAIKNCDRLYDY